MAIQTDPCDVRLEEYRQLYTLALYRLQVLDQRIPLATAALTAALGSVIVMPILLQICSLVAIPLAATMLCLSTFNHARSLEDALSGIAAIETAVNASLSADLLTFQSRHPSRHIVGGRTGSETSAIIAIATVAITAASTLAAWILPGLSQLAVAAHTLFAVILVGLSLREWCRLRRYRYEQQRATAT